MVLGLAENVAAIKYFSTKNEVIFSFFFFTQIFLILATLALNAIIFNEKKSFTANIKKTYSPYVKKIWQLINFSTRLLLPKLMKRFPKYFSLDKNNIADKKLHFNTIFKYLAILVVSSIIERETKPKRLIESKKNLYK